MIFEFLDKLLKKYKKYFGPFYEPACHALGALLTVFVFATIVAAPILALGSQLLAIVGQVALLAVYLFLLKAIQESKVERFAFSLAFLLIVMSAATTLDADEQLRNLVSTNDNLRVQDIPHLSLAVYGLLRGGGFFAWCIPLLLGFVTFAPDQEVESRLILRRSVWAALLLQSIALASILIYDGVYARVTAPIPVELPAFLSGEIRVYQRLYGITYVGSLLIGFAAVGVVALPAIKTRMQVLLIASLGAVGVSLVFLLSQTYAHELNLRYPGARQNESIQLYRDPSAQKVYFVHPFLSRIGGAYADYDSVFACEPNIAGQFQYVALPSSKVRVQRGSLARIFQEEPELLFCPAND